MKRTTQRLIPAGAAALCMALVGAFSHVGQAAPISYGNFGPVAPGVTFLNVTEDSGTDPSSLPLYGTPSPFSIGLDFNPNAFVATASGGALDVTDGLLKFTVASPIGIQNIGVAESGGYTLAGSGTNATNVSAAALVQVTVTEINGASVSPISLNANGNVSFNLAANAGVLQPWSLGVNLNITGLGAGNRATRVDVTINNQMLAVSQPSSLGFIDKKEFIISAGVVPEPGSAVLGGLALCGLALASRKRG